MKSPISLNQLDFTMSDKVEMSRRRRPVANASASNAQEPVLSTVGFRGEIKLIKVRVTEIKLRLSTS